MRSNTNHELSSTSPSASSNPIEDDVIIEDVNTSTITEPLNSQTVNSFGSEPTSSNNSVPKNNNSSEDDKNELFECNICFDTAQDPVITLCGHLFWFVGWNVFC